MKEQVYTDVNQAQSASQSTHRTSHKTRYCNICGDVLPQKYQQQYKLFCRRCKERSEVLRFADWMPEAKIVA